MKKEGYIFTGLGIGIILAGGYLFSRKKKKDKEEKERARKKKQTESWDWNEKILELGQKIVESAKDCDAISGPNIGTVYIKKDEVPSHKTDILALNCTGHFYYVKEGAASGIETTNAYFRSSQKIRDMNIPMSEIDVEKSEQTVRCGWRTKIEPPRPGKITVKLY